MTSSVDRDLVELKAIIAQWLEGLTLGGDPLPAAESRELLRQLSVATLSVDREGNHFLELPGLATLGMGIFRHSFHEGDRVVYVAPYAPLGSRPVSGEAARR